MGGSVDLEALKADMCMEAGESSASRVHSSKAVARFVGASRQADSWMTMPVTLSHRRLTRYARRLAHSSRDLDA